MSIPIPLKRKWSETEDSDSDEPSLGRQVLPVANLPSDFDGVPVDGLQYLFTVRRDARLLPHVTRAENPYAITEEPIVDAIKDLDYSGTNNHALPSEEWRETFLVRFRNFKKNFSQPTTHINRPEVSTQKIIPDRIARDYWWAFISGKPESEWNPPKGKNAKSRSQGYSRNASQFSIEYLDTQRGSNNSDIVIKTGDDEEMENATSAHPMEKLPVPYGTPTSPDRNTNFAKGLELLVSAGEHPTEGNDSPAPQREPTPAILSRIDHRYSMHLLMYFAHWINVYLEQSQPRTMSITETHARWIFALLARVDDYISADEMSTLRSLARGCMSLLKERIQQRPEAENDAIGEPSCWMIITSVIGLWGQKDLWVDAETMLSGLDL